MRPPKLEPRIHKKVSSSKLKLQLFPVNKITRVGLEKDGHNPFLELALSARKKISSVIRHLNTKWGSSSIAVGELILFPYETKMEQLSACTKWTSNDSEITARDVFVAVSSPSSFRLRYGWYSNLQPEISEIPPCETRIDDVANNRARVMALDENQVKTLVEGHGAGKETQEGMNTNTLLSDVKLKSLDVPNDRVDNEVSAGSNPVQWTAPWDESWTNLSIGHLLSEISLPGKINESDVNSVKDSTVKPIGLLSDASIGRLLSETSLQGLINCCDTKPEEERTLQPMFLPSSDISIGGLLSEASLLSSKRKLDTHSAEGGNPQLQLPWDDTFTTLSIGGLFSEASLMGKAGSKLEVKENKSHSLFNLSLLDSIDAFLAAQLNVDAQAPMPTCLEPNLSILDAEDTCHPFHFQKPKPSNADAPSSNERATAGGLCSSTNSKLFHFPKASKMNNGTGFTGESSQQEQKTNPTPSLD